MATKAIARRRPRAVFVTRSRSRAGKRIPLAVLAGMVPLAYTAYSTWKAGQPELVGRRIVAGLTGFDYGDGKWKPGEMRYGLVPILGGFMIHKLAGKLGVNRAIAKSGIPWVAI